LQTSRTTQLGAAHISLAAYKNWLSDADSMQLPCGLDFLTLLSSCWHSTEARASAATAAAASTPESSRLDAPAPPPEAAYAELLCEAPAAPSAGVLLALLSVLPALVIDVILTSTRSAPVISTTAFLLFFMRLLGSYVTSSTSSALRTAATAVLAGTMHHAATRTCQHNS
jgi:hypothetical protein